MASLTNKEQEPEMNNQKPNACTVKYDSHYL